MSEDTASTQPPKPAAWRRASRAVGPAGGAVATSAGVPVEAAKTAKVRPSRPAGPPPRRQPNGAMVALVSLVTALVLVAALGVVVALTAKHQRADEAKAAQNQLFVDTEHSGDIGIGKAAALQCAQEI